MQNLTEKNIRTLWLRMGQIYGHAWESGFGDVDQNNTWLTGLEGLTVSMLADGLRGCISAGLRFPPNLPEFRALCIGQINLADAVTATISGHYSSDPIVQDMRQIIGSWDLSHKSNDQLERLARQAYPRAVKHFEPILLNQAQQNQERLSHG